MGEASAEEGTSMSAPIAGVRRDAGARSPRIRRGPMVRVTRLGSLTA